LCKKCSTNNSFGSRTNSVGKYNPSKQRINPEDINKKNSDLKNRAIVVRQTIKTINTEKGGKLILAGNAAVTSPRNTDKLNNFNRLFTGHGELAAFALGIR
jgi:hypothetical protein